MPENEDSIDRLGNKPDNKLTMQKNTQTSSKPTLSSVTSGILKLLLKYNPFDPICDWGRKLLNELGILEIYDEFIYWNVGRANFIQFFRTFWGYEIKGKENFPEHGGALVIANHQSEFDPFLVGSAVHRKVQWLSKAENFEIPIFRSIIKPFGTIPLKRGQKDEAALTKVRSVLEGGGCVGMFPEGTRSPDGKLGPFRKGAARLCLETGVPYVPCAIFGAFKVFPKHVNVLGIRWNKGYKISVVIGNPVYIDPSLAPNIENAELVKEAMRNDVILLLSGKMNKSRIIRSKEDIAPVEILNNQSNLVKEDVATTSETSIPEMYNEKSKKKVPSEMDNLSIS
ncbi:MAG: 1-acyl-sn-glycerol-3-phosphate acyltransferase [Promethearchaeota archaeon]